MRLYTPPDLHYPIKVTKLLKREGDVIKANETLFVYSYTATVIEYDKDKREDVEKERTWPANFESELEGTLSSLNISVGQTIRQKYPVGEVEEACKHEVQYGGICAICGTDMTLNTYNTSVSGTSRATVNTVHAHTDLLVSQAEASKADEEAKRRLLDARKLILVVDLDQTVIHAAVEPTIGEWMSDASNPNHDAVKDVRTFQLAEDGPRGQWYYIKLRPGLQDFLETVAKYYELHIYTMGTRTYAQNIAWIIDPGAKLFGDRILSRDESGSMTAKNLKRLFPVDSNMVVIIDDRGDVWNWSPNLIKVNAFNFFVGIGDINSSFLPKQPESQLRPARSEKAIEDAPNGNDIHKDPTDAEAVGNGTAAGSASTTAQPSELSAVDQMVSMAGAQDEQSMQEKIQAQDETLTAQVEDRPLLKQQKRLEEEAEAEASPAVEAVTQELAGNGAQQEDVFADLVPVHKHKSLLRDDDQELKYLDEILRSVHREYYEEYDKRALGSKGGRIAELRPGQSKKRPIDDLDNIPIAAAIIRDIKTQVLSGVHIVFTGVFHVGVNIYNQELTMVAQSFGAKVGERINRRTTHVIASPERRTKKVRQGLARQHISVVDVSWLVECAQQWTKVPETGHLIHQDETGSAGLSEADLLSDDEPEPTDEDSGNVTDNATNGKLNSKLPLRLDTVTDTDAEDEDLEKYRPTFERHDSSPTDAEKADNWGELDDELAEFLGSDTEGDSDTESIGSSQSDDPSSGSASKRKRAETESDLETDGEGKAVGSRLQSRKRQALNRTSSLTNVQTVQPRMNGKKPAVAKDPGGDEGGSDLGLDDDDLEAALAAEMERHSEEEDLEE